ncbi:MAG: RDD family protein, partial [Anaeroplasmataceae bacterium]|nr:RDD family protein [Anaeroplasmataceae bacterium]
AYTHAMEAVMNFYKSYLSGNISTDFEELRNVMKSAGTMLGIKILFDLPIYTLYLVVLPYFWEKQTLGRCIMHLKVISKDESKAKPVNLILRELVGGLLLLNLLSSSIIIPILYWYFSASTGRSLADMIGGTRLIDDRYINQDYLYKEEDSYEDREYVDASFTEVSEKEEPADEDTDYKVF